MCTLQHHQHRSHHTGPVGSVRTGSRQTRVHHVFTDRILAPSQGADNCQLKTLWEQRAQCCRQCFPSYPGIAHSVPSQLAGTSQTFSWNVPFILPCTKITRLEIFFQLLKGTLVSLLTCPRQRLAGLSFPLCGLLWEFPALLLLRSCLKAAWIICLWLNQASNKWKQGHTHSLIFFNSCKDRV